MGYKEGGALFPKEGDKMLFSDADYLDTWKAMEQKVKEGKIRSIGLSNFGIKQIQRVIDNCQIKPAALQVECHPYFQQNELVEFCNKNSIAVTAYSPLATLPCLSTSPLIQISSQILIQKGICVIPKSVSESRIKENKNIWDFTLTEEEMTKMKGWTAICVFLI
uniref:NADP-dependent oxidoreductase domain-containing protein n=1 Tax=Ditylenchus dipsaci TaxID=166011 RepID=A0A915DSQ5_9BILA